MIEEGGGQEGPERAGRQCVGLRFPVPAGADGGEFGGGARRGGEGGEGGGMRGDEGGVGWGERTMRVVRSELAREMVSVSWRVRGEMASR